MIKLLKRWLDLRKKQRMLNYIDKACDEYFELKRKLKVQEKFVNILLEGCKEIYGEDLRTPKERGGE